MRLLPRLALILLLLPSPAFAASYLEAATIPATMIEPPPAPHGKTWEKEIKAIIAMQKHATASDIKAADDERSMHAGLVAAILPAPPAEGSAQQHLMNRVNDTTRVFSDQTKEYWHTDRPYLMDKRIKPLVTPPQNSPAYPSGHTTGSYVQAYVLAMLYPSLREKLVARAETIAQHRVLAGLHYPHDLAGGRQLALLIMGGLLQNPDFQHDLQAARQEIEAH